MQRHGQCTLDLICATQLRKEENIVSDWIPCALTFYVMLRTGKYWGRYIIHVTCNVIFFISVYNCSILNEFVNPFTLRKFAEKLPLKLVMLFSG